MNIRDNRLKIQSLFDKINHFSKKINQGDTISAIELDILKSHLANLYELLSFNNDTESSHTLMDVVEEHGSVKDSTQVVQAPDVNITEKVIIDSGNFEVSNENERSEEVLTDEKDEEQDFDLSGSIKVETLEVKLESKPKQESVANEYQAPKEQFKKEGPASLNDLFSIVEQKNQPFSPQKSQTNQESIRSLISINDKLLFISDLFNGDRDAYNDALDKLDTIASPDEAVDFINEEIAPKYDWIDKEQIAEIFFGIVKRKISY